MKKFFKVVTPESKPKTPSKISDEAADSEKKRKHNDLRDVDDDTCENLSPNYDDKNSEHPKKKPRKINIIDSDSDYTPSEDENTDPITPQPKRMKKSSQCQTPLTPSTPKTPNLKPTTPYNPATPSEKSLLSVSKFAKPSSPEVDGAQQYLHHTLKWLTPDKLRDKKKRLTSDEDYDGRTLYVPSDFLNKCTPGMKQWWTIKSDHYDLILFFKVGKFYELYHMDAEVAVKELGLVYMRGNFAHCGFPEKAFGRYSETLIQKGYRVARIEQTERPEDKPKSSKTVSRELCAVITKGTKTNGFLEGRSPNVESCYLMAVCEDEDQYGICLVDTSVGHFQLSQFSDDRHSSRLRTIISHFNIVQVLYARKDITAKLQNVLKLDLCQALHEPLAKDTEFWNGCRLLKELANGKYFRDDSVDEDSWPESLTRLTVGESGGFSDEPLPDYALALSSLGACVHYLKSCLIERPLLTLKQFSVFLPSEFNVRSATEFPKPGQKLVLDNTAIANLEILRTNDGKYEGSLLSIIDKCVTAPGKRLLRKWLCSPLTEPSLINERLDAIENLLTNPGKVKQVQKALSKIPDLERGLRKIHTIGTKHPSEHPDSRAVLFELDFYGKKKITELTQAIDGFRELTKILKFFDDVDISSNMLKQTVSINNESGFPDLQPLLKFYSESFDREEALKNGIIIPNKGVNEDYDNAIAEIRDIEENFDKLLRQYKLKLGCSMSFFGAAKNRFQVEVPDSSQSKIPRDWEVQSQRKGYVRYYFPETAELKVSLAAAEIRKEDALKNTMRVVFNSFSKNYETLNKAVRCSSTLDVLLSLSQYSSSFYTCRPEIIASSSPFIDIVNGKHPTLLPFLSDGEFIPNDTKLGDEHANNILIVTGPNMGGKSTLMRQVGLLVILAQIGCYVPSQSMKLSPVDRIFTRLGASDNITRGESTFFVELAETSCILHHASAHSLVILDELGRGTATYDGTAIAGSVIQDLVDNIKCRTLFSTHYHRLVDELKECPGVDLAHMSCLDVNEGTDNQEQDITFLYKLSDGACPKSFGFNAAKLAGLPKSCIMEAQKVANQFEVMSDKFHLFAQLVSASEENVDSLVEKILAL